MKKCIIWGAGYFGKVIFPRLLYLDYQIMAYVDSNEEITDTKIGGITVFGISQAINLCNENPDIEIIVGIVNEKVVQEVCDIVKDKFPHNISIKTGKSVMDEYGNKYLEDIHRKIVFRWNVSLQEYMNQWLDNLMSEVEFWAKEVVCATGLHHEDIDLCSNQKYFEHWELQSVIKPGQIVMDIGCGLMSKFGEYINDQDKISLIPVDALAYFYNSMNQMIEDKGLRTDYKCNFGLFEFMSLFYPMNYADYIIIDNALDHCMDPLRSIIECLYVVKTNGSICMGHRRAEAVFEEWQGLHKWNIDCVDGNLVFWNMENAVNVCDILRDYAEIRIVYDENEKIRENQIIYVKVTKLRDFEISDLIDTSEDKSLMVSYMNSMMKKFADDSLFFQKLKEKYIECDYESAL